MVTHLLPNLWPKTRQVIGDTQKIRAPNALVQADVLGWKVRPASHLRIIQLTQQVDVMLAGEARRTFVTITFGRLSVARRAPLLIEVCSTFQLLAAALA
jgi:hypothetical protein